MFGLMGSGEVTKDVTPREVSLWMKAHAAFAWILKKHIEKDVFQTWRDIQPHSCWSASCRSVYLFLSKIDQSSTLFFFLHPRETLFGGGSSVHVCVSVCACVFTCLYMCGVCSCHHVRVSCTLTPALSAFTSRWREYEWKAVEVLIQSSPGWSAQSWFLTLHIDL